MTPEEVRKAARSVAGICAKGYDDWNRLHGPKTDFAETRVNTYVTEQTEDGAVAYCWYGGQRFAVTVTPAEG
jgi:hypothetical protein